MGGVQFAFLTLPLHSQRELCVAMFGTGCIFFRIFIVGAHTRSYVNLLRPHILQPVCLVSYIPTRLPNLPIHNSLHIDPSNHLPTYLLSYTHKHTYTRSYNPRFGHRIVADITCLSSRFPIQFTSPRKKRSEHVKNKEHLRFTPQGVVLRYRDKFTSVLVC
jgi:hypothetical protein